MILLLFLHLLIVAGFCFIYHSLNHSCTVSSGRKRTGVRNAVFSCGFSRAKPPWVKDEIVYLKTLMPDVGCRKVAAAFNRKFAASRNISVSKSYVNNVIRNHLYEIHVLHKQMKHQKPRSVPRNLIWGVDLTGKSDRSKNQYAIFAVLEHHSRAALSLSALKDKSSVTLLHILLDCMARFGKPKIIRTDNEVVFSSRLFQLALWLLDIKHQKTDLPCPWQNGRVERFFGTLKEKLNQWQVYSFDQLNRSLAQFRFWYHHVRPHQYLNDRTPAEVWNDIDIFHRKSDEVLWFEAWDGLLTGEYLPP